MRLRSITVAGAVPELPTSEVLRLRAAHRLPVTLRPANSSGIGRELTALTPLTQASPAMPSAELTAALDAARAAAEVIRGFYQRNVRIEVKADKTPVTEADVRSEEAIRELLTRRFPSYGFYGEETGKSHMDAESVWLVDPIDGTKSFVRECPFFSTQIALMRGGKFVLGVSCAPAYGELAWAERGRGAFLDGKPMRVSQVDSLAGAIVSTGNLKTLAASTCVGASRRPDWRRQPHPWLWRFRALPPAGARRARPGDRIRREHSRHRGAHRDRRGGRRPVHRSHRRRRWVSRPRPCWPATARCTSRCSTTCASAS